MAILSNERATTGVSTSISVSATKGLAVTVSGTSTSFTLGFEASINGIDFYPVMGVLSNDPEFNFVYQTTTKDTMYTFDVSMYKAFRTNLSAIANGYITVEVNEER